MNAAEIAKLSGVEYHRVWRGLHNPRILTSDERADIQRAIREVANSTLRALETVTFTPVR